MALWTLKTYNVKENRASLSAPFIVEGTIVDTEAATPEPKMFRYIYTDEAEAYSPTMTLDTLSADGFTPADWE